MSLFAPTTVGPHLIGRPSARYPDPTMSSPATAELKAAVLRTFGRQISDDEARRRRGRWRSMVDAATRLRQWEGRLGEIAPAVVYAAPANDPEARDRG